MDLDEKFNDAIAKIKDNLITLRVQAKDNNTLELIGLNETYIALFEDVVAKNNTQNPKLLLLLNNIIFVLNEKK